MGWPTVDTYERNDELRLIDYLKTKTASDLAKNRFWPGDYDDLSCALLDAGWRVTWYEPYWFAMQSKNDGSWAEYIEGDIYTRKTLFDCDLYKENMRQRPCPGTITIFENGCSPQVITDF